MTKINGVQLTELEPVPGLGRINKSLIIAACNRWLLRRGENPRANKWTSRGFHRQATDASRRKRRAQS